MDQAHRSVALLCLLLACGGDDASPPEESTCKPFAKPPPIALGTAPVGASESALLFSRASVSVGDVTFTARPTATGFDVERTADGDTVVLASIAKPVAADASLPIAPGGDGRLVVAGGDTVFTLSAATPSAPETLAAGFVAPRALFVDPATKDVWLVDREAGGDVAHRVRANVSRVDAPGFFLPSRVDDDGAVVVVRDGRSPNLEGRLVYTSNGSLVVVEPFGPAGPPIAKSHPFGAGVLVGTTSAGSAIVSANGARSTVEDTSTSTAPRTLGASGCLDPSAIAYDVASPLWSDGADKSRAVVLPPGTEARVLPDGDLKFPVGTIAIKTFTRGGKKIETRLFVQHALDDWAGYSYAWNEAGTDADLVIGNAVKDGWYFPSTGDCNACHTAAAGFTLGLDVRQLDDAAKAKLAPGASQPRFTANDARAYLHANCSGCHREGNATGTADLDLRFDAPLDAMGVCKDDIVTPGAPEKSILVARMRATDETRMPKLARSIVDEAGIAVVESWIRGLGSCP